MQRAFTYYMQWLNVLLYVCIHCALGGAQAVNDEGRANAETTPDKVSMHLSKGRYDKG